MKKFFTGLTALLVLICSCFAFTACKDIKKVEIKVEVFDGVESYSEYTLTLDMYRHLAPNTVDTIISYINDGYYNDAIFYKNKAYDTQVMFGDFKLDGAELVQKEIMPTIDGEFEKAGVKGSNLKNVRGAVGLWRSWYDSDDLYKTSSSAVDTGRANWYMPSITSASYNSNFCIFAMIDLDNTDNSDALTAIEDALSSINNYLDYEVYFTGEYDVTKANQNHGLTFNSVLASEFNEDDIDGLFTADGEQLVCYNHYTVRIPVVADTTQLALRLVSIKVK